MSPRTEAVLPVTVPADESDAAKPEPVAQLDMVSPASPKNDGWDDDDDDEEEGVKEDHAAAQAFKKVVKACMGGGALYTFNLIALLISAVLVGGQLSVADQMDFKNAELLVLGGTVAALGILSLMGLYGTAQKAQTVLRL